MMNVGMYQIRADPQKTEDQADYCFVSFHRSSAVNHCLPSLRNTFREAAQSLNIDILTKVSLLVAISELALEAFKASMQKVIKNHNREACIRIQVVP